MRRAGGANSKSTSSGRRRRRTKAPGPRGPQYHMGSEEVRKLRFDDNELARNLFGVQDAHLRSIEKRLGVHIEVRGADVSIRGGEPQTRLAEKILLELYSMLKKGYPVYTADLEQAIRLFSANQAANLQDL